MLDVKHACKLAIEYFADLYEKKYPNSQLLAEQRCCCNKF